MKQSLLIFSAILLGILLPYGSEYTYLIRYNLIIMLLFAFLSIKVERTMFTRLHGVIALSNIAIPIVLYFIFLPLGSTLALTAFLMGITPTAAGAPILAQFLKTDVGFVTTSVVINTPLMALAIPILLPLLVPVDQPIAINEVLMPVLSIIGIPLLIAELIKRSSGSLTQSILRFRSVAFVLFLFNVWLGCGKATHYILYEQNEPWETLALIALITAITCLINFKIGERLKRNDQPYAGGLATGRKNTMFALWLSLTFLSPILVLGPIFYILCQNIYNSYQIMKLERVERL